MTAVAGLMSWFGIAVTYIRFHKGMKAQGFDRNTLPYKSMFQPYAAWYAAISCIVICFVSRLSFAVHDKTHLTFGAALLQFSGWAVFLKGNWAQDVFVTNYFPLMLFPVLYIGSYIWTRKGFVRPADMDFKSGLAEIEAACYDEPPPRNWVEKVWGWLVRIQDFCVFRVGADQAMARRCNAMSLLSLYTIPWRI